MDRIATFRRFIDLKPADPFPRYGLAMELRGQGQLDAAIATFDELIGVCPTYVPTYLLLGTTLTEAGQRARAAEVLAAGCEVARAAGDKHALGELEGALAALEDS